MLLSVVIPVFNERTTIRELVKRVLSIDLEKEVILVDDGSEDGTQEVLRELEKESSQVIAVYHSQNRGKGAALRTGFAQASGEYVIVQDADLEYNPQDIYALLEPIKKGVAQVVYGSRFAEKSKRELYSTGNMHWFHLLGNKFLTTVTNLLYGSKLTDMETCYKLIPRNLLQGIDIKSDRFNFEPEMTAKILKRGYAIYEVPISYAGREISEGKNISWRDGPAALWALIKYRFVE
jgi:glycosyltransferase involved in cell wall biosynthesis